MPDGAQTEAAAMARIAQLREAARACRKSWRRHWGRFWKLRWENSMRRPSWRVEAEAQAWRRMRVEVRRYAELRRQIAELTAATED